MFDNVTNIVNIQIIPLWDEWDMKTIFLKCMWREQAHFVAYNIRVREDTATIIEQPLFHNPQSFNELIAKADFIKGGFTQLKAICYEVIPAFLTQSSIVEIIQSKCLKRSNV